ncbi:MAG: cytochrome ubiquinol oxidase subunit I [Pseudonocardiaceae bacterium]
MLEEPGGLFSELAHTWAKAMGVVFAVGAVSGTILSFEMDMLWPMLMERFGEVYGFPFTLEGFACPRSRMGRVPWRSAGGYPVGQYRSPCRTAEGCAVRWRRWPSFCARQHRVPVIT